MNLAILSALLYMLREVYGWWQWRPYSSCPSSSARRRRAASLRRGGGGGSVCSSDAAATRFQPEEGEEEENEEKEEKEEEEEEEDLSFMSSLRRYLSYYASSRGTILMPYPLPRCQSHDLLYIYGARLQRWLEAFIIMIAVVLCRSSNWSCQLTPAANVQALEAYLSLFESNHLEISPAVPTVTTGHIPAWLEGMFLRNGPGAFDTRKTANETGEQPQQEEEEGRVLQGWIDGYAKIEQWKIQNGQVFFGTKFLRSTVYNKSQAKENVPFIFGLIGPVTPAYPSQGLWDSIQSMTDNTNINVWAYANDTIAVTGDFHVRDFTVHPETLDTHRLHFAAGSVRKVMGGRTSHPHHAVNRTDLSYSVTIPFLDVPGLGYHMCLEAIRPVILDNNNSTNNETKAQKGSGVQRHNVACHWIPRMTNFHSVGISSNYAVLLESPLHAQVNKMEVIKGNVSVHLNWDASIPPRVLIAGLHTSNHRKQQQQFQAFPLLPANETSAYCGHVVNTWEEATDDPNEVDLVTDWECVDGNQIVWILSGCRPHHFCPHPAEHSAFLPAVWRFRFRLRTTNDTSSSTDFTLVRGGLEHKFQMHIPDLAARNETTYGLFVRSNYDYRGRPHCYYYSFGIHATKHEWFITKSNLCAEQQQQQPPDMTLANMPVDAATGHKLVPTQRWYRPGHVPTEPVFVPRPGATAEDDGVLLSSVHDTNLHKTYLGIWNASTLELLSTSYAPIQSIFGLHGRFFDFERKKSY